MKFPDKREKPKWSDHPGVPAVLVMCLTEERMVVGAGWTYPLKKPKATPGEGFLAKPSPISQQNQLRSSGACWGTSPDPFQCHRQLPPASRKAQAVPSTELCSRSQIRAVLKVRTLGSVLTPENCACGQVEGLTDINSSSRVSASGLLQQPTAFDLKKMLSCPVLL